MTALAALGGATLGTILVECYRQGNRLRLAAIDRRLDAYQKAHRLAFDNAVHLSVLQDFKETSSEDAKQAKHELEKQFEVLRKESREWILDHYLYLDGKVNRQIAKAI